MNDFLPAPCPVWSLCPLQVQSHVGETLGVTSGTKVSKLQGSMPCGQAQRPRRQGAGGGDEGKGPPASLPPRTRAACDCGPWPRLGLALWGRECP